MEKFICSACSPCAREPLDRLHQPSARGQEEAVPSVAMQLCSSAAASQGQALRSRSHTYAKSSAALATASIDTVSCSPNLHRSFPDSVGRSLSASPCEASNLRGWPWRLPAHPYASPVPLDIFVMCAQVDLATVDVTKISGNGPALPEFGGAVAGPCVAHRANHTA